MEKKFNKLEESMEAFMKSQTTFMQNQGQTLSNHSQAIIEIGNADESISLLSMWKTKGYFT